MVPQRTANSQPVNNNTQHHRTNAEAQKNVSTETAAAAVIEKNVNQQNSARSSTLNSNAASFYAYPSNNNMHQNIAVQNEMVPNVGIENQFPTVPNNVHEFDAWLNNFDAPLTAIRNNPTFHFINHKE